MQPQNFEGHVSFAYTFLRDPNGAIMLCALDRSFAPIAVFASASTFREFVVATQKAYEAFIPLPVREAMELLEDYDEEREDKRGTDKDSGEPSPKLPTLPTKSRRDSASPRDASPEQ